MAVVITDNISTFHDLNTAPTREDVGGSASGSQGIGGGIEGTGAGNTMWGRRVDNTNRGFFIDLGSGVDVSAAGSLIGIWVNNLWPSFIQPGTRPFELIIASAAMGEFNYFGWAMFEDSASATKPYPPDAGWQRVWVAVNEITPTKNIGTDPTMSSIRNIGVWVSMGNVPGTAATVFVDNITYLPGGGIFLDCTTTAASVADFSEFVAYDWDDLAVRQGVVIDRSGTIECYGRLGIADGGLCDFTSVDETIIFADQRGLINADTMGVTVSLSNALTDVIWTRLTLGSAGVEQGDLIVIGTSGVLNADGFAFSNLRVVELTTACTLANGVFTACGLISGHANLSGSKVLVSTGAVSVDWNLNADPDGELDNMTFESDGSNHAIELGSNTPGTITLRGHSYIGYSGTSTNATIYNNSGKAITINVADGGDTPTVRNGVGAATTVQNSVSITFTGHVTSPASRLFLTTTATGPDASNELANELMASDPHVVSYAYVGDQGLSYNIGNASSTPIYKRVSGSGTVTDTGAAFNISQVLDE